MKCFSATFIGERPVVVAMVLPAVFAALAAELPIDDSRERVDDGGNGTL
jgi:hypothetical protein